MSGSARPLHRSTPFVLLAALALSLPACTCSSDPACSKDEDCPAGSTCSLDWNVCVAPPAPDIGWLPLDRDAGHGGDAGHVADTGHGRDAGEPGDSGEVEPHGDAGLSGLELTGPETIGVGTCRRFVLAALDVAGQHATLSSTVDVALVGCGAGHFYADSLCTSVVETATLGPDSPERDFYLRDDTAESLVLTASASGLASGSTGVTVVDFEQAWTQQQPLASAPALHAPKAVYHRARGTIVMYGGWDATNWDYSVSLPAQMWEYDGSAWTKLCDDCAPGGRYGHGLIYDTARDRIVLFGGQTPTSEYNNDLWEWDSGHGWVLVDEGGTPEMRPDLPPPNKMFSFAWDEARGRAVLFGGYPQDASGPDTWELDPAARTWAKVSDSAVDTGPGGHCDYTSNLVFDPGTDRMLLYGGQDCSTSWRRDSLWAWDGTTWTKLCYECTGNGREGHGMVVDRARGKLVVTQGYDDQGEITGTWEQDLSRLSEVPWPSSDAGPDPARDGMIFVWYPELGGTVFFGGNAYGVGDNYDDTWLYAGP